MTTEGVWVYFHSTGQIPPIDPAHSYWETVAPRVVHRSLPAGQRDEYVARWAAFSRRIRVFDAHDDEMPARDVPAEAHRRFRADLQNARARVQQERAEGLRVHEARKLAIAEWVASQGTAEQQARHAAGLLPMDEAIEAMTDQAFAPLKTFPRYQRDGGLCLQVFLRQSPRYADAVVTPVDFKSLGRKADRATAAQWARMQEMQAAVPEATVALHVRELTWLVDPKAPRLIQHTIVVTQQVGALVLRREYDAPAA